MKKLLLLVLVLSMAFALCSWKEDLWEDACYSEDSMIKLYNGTAHFWSLGPSLLEIEAEPPNRMVFSVNHSRAVVGTARPVIPTEVLSQEYPTGRNYTFFIPVTDFTGNEKVELTIVGNDTLGCPVCGVVSFSLPDLETPNTLPLNVSAGFNASIRRFEVSVRAEKGKDIGDDEVAVYAAIVDSDSQRVMYLYKNSFSGDPQRYVIDYPLSSQDVSGGKYCLYVIAARDSSGSAERFVKYFHYFEFADFDLSIPDLPQIYPGDSYVVRVTLNNTGTLADTYDLRAEVPEGWKISLSPSHFQLPSGGQKEVEISFEVSKFHQGEGDVVLYVNSTHLGVKKYTLRLFPEKRVVMEMNIESPSELISYSENPVRFKVYAAGTVEPKVFWIVYTEPALDIDGGWGEGKVVRGIGNNFTANVSVGGACGFREEDTAAFNAGRRVLVLSRVAYSLSGDISNDTILLLRNITSRINEEKLAMTTEDSMKLYDDAEKVAMRIEDVIDAYEYGTPGQVASRKESLYLASVDYQQDLKDVAEKMMETCSRVDKVDFYVYMFVSDLGEEKITKVSNLPIRGSSVLDLTGPREVKAISGSVVSVDYVLKNNADQDFQVEFESTSDIITPPAYLVSLPAGQSRKVTFKFYAPAYMEEKGMSASVIVRAGTYELEFPLKVDVGKFSPEIRMDDRQIAASPGKVSEVNVTVSTGGLDDSFRIDLDAPSWISAPKEIKTEGGYGYITLRLEPPANIQTRSVDCILEIYSSSFPDYFDRKSFTVIIGRQSEELSRRLEDDRSLLDSFRGEMKSTQYVTLKRKLDEAEDYIESGEYTKAKVRLGDVERALKILEEKAESNKGVNPILILLLLAGAGFGVWKFLLPKLVSKEPSSLPQSPREPPGEVGGLV